MTLKVGKIKWFNLESGLGIISADDMELDEVFFNLNDILIANLDTTQLVSNCNVFFKYEQAENGPRVTHLEITTEY